MASNHNVLSVGELQEWLNKKADIEEVKLTDFSDAFAKMLNYNALNCLLNREVQQKLKRELIPLT